MTIRVLALSGGIGGAGRAILLLRHARTRWNEEGRIQGHGDSPLSEAGRASLAGLGVPGAWRDAEWHVSPLERARETARALGARACRLEPRLMEMSWGRWEGQRLDDLRRRHGDAMRVNEAAGIDFRPDGGESPRDVCARLRDWVAELDVDGPPVVAVTHKGVIRAALALATGWNMREDFAERLDWRCGHAFARGGAGGLELRQLNVALVRARA